MDLYQILESLKKVENSNMPVAVDSTSPVGGNVQEHGYEDLPGVHRSTGIFDIARQFKFKDHNDYLDQRDAIYQALSNSNIDSITKDELKQKLQGIEMAAKLAGLQEDSKFSFANPKQRPGDQVRGTERATKKKSGKHPFAGRLVGATEAKATSQRLDPKCWKGYKKQGTKVKGGVRVNNCVPMEEEYEQYLEDLVNEYGMTTGGTAMGNTQKPDPETAKKIATVTQGVNKLKSAGANVPSGQQAVQSLMKDPVKDPQSQLDKTIDAGLGQEVQDIVTKGDAGDVNQLANLIRKINQKSGA